MWQKRTLQFCTNQQAGIARFHSYHAYGVNYTGTSQLEKVKEGIPALLKQTGENSINSNTAFKKMQKQDGDINMLISPSSLLSAYANPLNYGISHNIDLKDLKMLGSLSFEKGKIELKVESYTENTELKALFEKQIKSTCPIENTFLKYFPKSTLALFSIGINGEEFYNVLQENEQFRNDFSITKAAEVKDLFSAFHNDLTIGLINVTMNSNPSFLAYASVKNDAPLKALYEKKSELGLKRGEDIVKLNENEMSINHALSTYSSAYETNRCTPPMTNCCIRMHARPLTVCQRDGLRFQSERQAHSLCHQCGSRT